MKFSVKLWLPIAGLLLATGYFAFPYYQKRQKEIFLAASPAEKGWLIMCDKGCLSCHQPDSAYRAPILKNLYGRTRLFIDDKKLVADDVYIRQSILQASSQIVVGYQAVMPSYVGQFSSEELSYLVEAMKPEIPH